VDVSQHLTISFVLDSSELLKERTVDTESMPYEGLLALRKTSWLWRPIVAFAVLGDDCAKQLFQSLPTEKEMRDDGAGEGFNLHLLVEAVQGLTRSGKLEISIQDFRKGNSLSDREGQMFVSERLQAQLISLLESDHTELHQKLSAWLQIRRRRESMAVVAVYQKGTRDAVTVTVADVATLFGDNWLNDSMIDFGLRFIVKTLLGALGIPSFVFGVHFWLKMKVQKHLQSKDFEF
jgi:hypothetical protein